MSKKEKKAMKARRKAWLEFEEIYADEKAKANLAKLFIHEPDPERPVQFVGPRELHMASCDMMQAMMASRREALVEPTKKYLEVREVLPWGEGDLAEFEKMPDGTFHVSIEGQSDDRFQGVTLTPEQFAAFKQWVMEN